MNFYRQFYLAITDFGFYQRHFRQSLRRSLRYLLFLAAHVAVFLTLYWAWFIFPAADRFFTWAESNFPAWQIQEGQLEVSADPPLKRVYEADSSWTFIFDTTGTYDDATGVAEPAVLFLREKLVLKHSGQTQTHFWKDLGNFQVQPRDMSSFRTYFKWVYFPVVYSWLLIWTLLAKSVQGLLLSLVAMSTASLYGVRLDLKQSFTIALYSLTPAIVIDLLVKAVGVEVYLFDIIYLFTAAIYAYLATQRCVTAE